MFKLLQLKAQGNSRYWPKTHSNPETLKAPPKQLKLNLPGTSGVSLCTCVLQLNPINPKPQYLSQFLYTILIQRLGSKVAQDVQNFRGPPVPATLKRLMRVNGFSFALALSRIGRNINRANF